MDNCAVDNMFESRASSQAVMLLQPALCSDGIASFILASQPQSVFSWHQKCEQIWRLVGFFVVFDGFFVCLFFDGEMNFIRSERKS